MLYRRYVFFQTLLACVAACFFFVGVLLAGNAVKDLLRLVAGGQMSPVLFAKAILTLIPSVIAYALPLGMVAGVLATVGRLSAQNEFLILQISGVSLRRIVSPILFLSLLASALSLGINFFYAPRAIHAYRHALKILAFQTPMQFIRPHCFITAFSGYVLFIENQTGNMANGLYAWELGPHGQLKTFLRAESGEFCPTGEGLRLDLRRGAIERCERQANVPSPSAHFGKFTLFLPFNGNEFLKKQSKPLKHMDIFELLAAIGHRSPPDTPSEIRPETQKRSDFIAVNYVIQQHLSSAVAIFLLTLIAIPMAMQTRRTESAAGTLIALALVLCYYFASIIISWFQMLPGFRVDLLIWLPDAILAVVALKFWRIFRSKIVSAKPNAG